VTTFYLLSNSLKSRTKQTLDCVEVLTLNFLFFNHLMKINFVLAYHPSLVLKVMSIISLPSVNILISSKNQFLLISVVLVKKKHTYN